MVTPTKQTKQPTGIVDGKQPGVLTPPYLQLTLGIISTVLLIAFEAMAVGTVMPVAVRGLDGMSLYALAFSAYFTTSLLAMVVSGTYCDSRGPKGPLYSGIAAFAVGLVISGTAQSMIPFVVGRAVQGLGGGLVIVALYVFVGRAYPERLRPKVFSAFSAAWVLPSIVGPPVAGFVNDTVGWRWVFLAIPVLIVLPLVIMTPGLRGSDSPSGKPVDKVRIAYAAAAALGAGLLQSGGQHLSEVWGIVLLVIGFLTLVPTVPKLLPKGTLKVARGLPTVILLRGIAAGAFFSAESFVPLMLVSEHGLSTTVAGLTLTSGALSWAVGSWIQGRVSSATRPRLLPVGFVLIAFATAGAALAVVWSPYVVIPAWLLGGCGMGLMFSSMGVLTLEMSKPDEAGNNTSALQVSESLGNIMMLAVAGAVFAGLHQAEGQDARVFTIIFSATAAVAVVGSLLAPRARPKG